MKIRFLMPAVLIVLTVFAATSVGSRVGKADSRHSRLQLTSYIIGQRYCGPKVGEADSLHIELMLRYTNIGETTLILYNGIHSVIRKTLSRTLEDISHKRFLVDASNLVVTSQMPPIGPGMTSGKSFVTLRPNASFETKTSVVILLTRQDNQVDETTLPPGDYFLQVTVRTWPESHALPVKLSRAWSGNGAFWYSNVTCQPVRLNIAENPYNEDCSAFGDPLREGLANPNATDLSGNTVLMAAVYQDEKETFLELLKKGANVNAKTQNGFTTLILAAGRGNFDAVVELLSRGADPNVKTDEGETALLQALSKCEPEIVKALIDAGADVNIRNRNGKSTLSLAESCSHDERSRIIGLLKKAGAR